MSSPVNPDSPKVNLKVDSMDPTDPTSIMYDATFALGGVSTASAIPSTVPSTSPSTNPSKPSVTSVNTDQAKRRDIRNIDNKI